MKKRIRVLSFQDLKYNFEVKTIFSMSSKAPNVNTVKKILIIRRMKRKQSSINLLQNYIVKEI